MCCELKYTKKNKGNDGGKEDHATEKASRSHFKAIEARRGNKNRVKKIVR